MISHKEFNVSKEIEFPNKNMFPYDVTGSWHYGYLESEQKNMRSHVKANF